MSALENGGFVATWHSNDITQLENHGVFVKIFDQDGNETSNEFKAHDNDQWIVSDDFLIVNRSSDKLDTYFNPDLMIDGSRWQFGGGGFINSHLDYPVGYATGLHWN